MIQAQLNKLIKFFEKKNYQVYNLMSFGHQISPEPPFKKILFPSGEPIVEYHGHKQKEILDHTKRVLLGLHPLDLKALALWQQVFAKDPVWQSKMQNTVIIGRTILPLKKTEDTFFFETFEENFLEHTKFDLFLCGPPKKYKVFTGSLIGQKILEDFGYADYSHVDFMGPVREEGLDQQVLAIRAKLKNKYLKKIWEKYGQKCLECGKCTYVCPTCFCFDLVDKPGQKPGCGVKVREWTSCLFPNFSEVAGGHKFQRDTAERLFFWYYHKFVRIPEEFGMPGCVGCNRCTKACPVGIDIRKVIKDILKF